MNHIGSRLYDSPAGAERLRAIREVRVVAPGEESDPGIRSAPRFGRDDAGARFAGRSHQRVALGEVLCSYSQPADTPRGRKPNRPWRVDETYVRVAGKWTYLYRAVDSEGNTIDFMRSPYRDLTTEKPFLQVALDRTDKFDRA